jgi:hypothetical protein
MIATQQKKVNLLPWIALFIAALLAATAMANSNGLSLSLGTTGQPPQPTLPGGEQATEQIHYNTIDDLPNAQAYPNSTQLNAYNNVTRRIVERVQTINRESSAGGMSPAQIDAMDTLNTRLATSYVPPQELVRTLSNIYPNVNVLGVVNALEQEALVIFQTYPAMVVPYFGG